MDYLEEISPEQFNAILDSKLIVTTIPKELLYDIKLVDCGDYAQVYIYESKKYRGTKQDQDVDLQLKKLKLDNIVNKNVSNDNNDIKLFEINDKNIIRSKLECQRIAKANMKEWETFITLTFAENITDINYANKRLRYFIDKVKRVKKDFKYLCIPEFQKRGAVHYHLLTNICINDSKLIVTQEDNEKFKHVKYWLDGFTSVEVMKNDAKKVVGYISKYMTKDIDNRLFNHHRYFYSRNLIKPKANFINLDSMQDLEFYKKIIQDCALIYQNDYINPYDNNKVRFLEYLKK